MRQISKFALVGVFCAMSTLTFAQITGKVTDASTGGALPGATVVIEGNSTGTATGPDGTFKLNLTPEGTLVVSFIGYETANLTAKTDMGVINLQPTALGLASATVIANVVDVAQVRSTPVAVSTISPQEIELKVGNQEFPEIMNSTPGVYATKQGGGYGDSRISLRGFDQRNTSFLINGQPVNDMENGWVYWSNWQGLTDVASGIQIQRGLGASRLAVPSVGGTVSIVTKAAQMEEGGSVSETVGNDGYVKTSINYNTGKNDNGWASSFLLSKWAGDGYVYGTQGEGWTYFGAIGYAPDDSDHALNLSLLGAGQWHHQRDAWVSIRDYQNFGSDHKEGIDRRWNTDAGFLNGEEYSMRRNFYNKPLATFNWDWEISDNLTLNTSVYGSAGRGGGTGPRGQYFRNGEINNHPYNADLTQHYLIDSLGTRDENGFIDFDAVVAANVATTNGYGTTDSLTSSPFYGQLIGSNGYRDNDVNRAVEVRRASMNSHDWVGAISNLEYHNGNWRTSVGVDLRNYKGYHYRALNDLLGLDGYYSTGDENSQGLIITEGSTIEANPFSNTGLNGPKLDYYNVGLVKWAGLNGLVEYDNDVVSAVVQAGVSNQSYQRVDYFDQPGNVVSEVATLPGGYLKGGANYNLDERSNVFFNAGLISRQPNFDAVFPNYANNVNEDIENEQIKSIEFGYGFVSNNLTLNANVYSTSWGNRFTSRGFDVFINDSTSVEGTAQFSGINSLHNGLELEATYRPTNRLKLNGMVSMGDWRYTKNFEAAIFDDNNNEIGTGTLYVNGAKIGDAAQFTANAGVDYRIGNNINVDMRYRFVDGLYADWGINNSDFYSPDNAGALQLPSFGLADLGATVRLFDNKATFRVNVNNLFDTVYIAESNTNIHADDTSTTWNGVDVKNSVWFGFGRTWNASLKYNF